MFFCASCAVKNCAKRLGEEGEYPRTCPTLRPQLAEVLREYEEPQTRLLAQASAISNLDHTESRVQQTVRFARNCGYKKLGIAFCITLSEAARTLADYLRQEGFEVESVICKVGHHERECIGISDPRKKPMCNPVAQAQFLNEEKTELNIIVGAVRRSRFAVYKIFGCAGNLPDRKGSCIPERPGGISERIQAERRKN